MLGVFGNWPILKSETIFIYLFCFFFGKHMDLKNKLLKTKLKIYSALV